MNQKHIINMLAVAIQADVPIYIVGPPGAGKTANTVAVVAPMSMFRFHVSTPAFTSVERHTLQTKLPPSTALDAMLDPMTTGWPMSFSPRKAGAALRPPPPVSPTTEGSSG